MALFRSVLKLPIDDTRELHVVLEDRNPRVIFTLNEQVSEHYKERKTFILSPRAAMRLVMFIANISSMDALPDQTVDDDQE